MQRTTALLLLACLVSAPVVGAATAPPPAAAASPPTPVASGGSSTVPAPGGVGAQETTTATPTRTPADGDATVLVRAQVPTDDGGTRNETVLTAADVSAVGDVQRSRSGGVYLPVTLTPSGAESFADDLQRLGFAGDGGARCQDGEGRCLHTVVDGEVALSAGVAPSFARTLRNGDFEADPRFRVLVANESQARRLADALGDEAGTATSTAVSDGDGSPTPTPSATDAAGMSGSEGTTAGGESGDGADDASDGGSLPGFGALAALSAVALWTARRR